MNILFLTENFPPEVNAAASRVYERACLWVAAGHQVTVITCAPNFPQGKIYPGYKNKWYQEEIMHGIRVIRVKTFIAKNEGIVLRTLDFISYMFSAAPVALSYKKPDVIVATTPQFFAAVAGWFVAALKRAPFVLELSDLWPASIAAVGAMQDNFILRMLEKVELFLYRKAKAIVALSTSIKEDLVKRHVPAAKISVIVNGVDMTKYAPQSRNQELATKFGVNDNFVVGYIGTHGLAQGLENIIVTAKILRAEKNLIFLFVGTGAAKERLMQQATEEKLTNIIFIEPQPKNLMPAVWSLCNVALVHLKNAPLFTGVLPSKMFEAMGMGLPLLLAAPTGEASAIIEKTGAGVCVAPENPDALAQAVLTYKNDPVLCQAKATKSQQAASLYTRERQATDFLMVLEKVTLSEQTMLTNIDPSN